MQSLSELNWSTPLSLANEEWECAGTNGVPIGDC